MISGIFSVTFASNQNVGGYGVAVFSGNAVHGGDASHYYRGKYKLDERNLISGTIEVVKYSTLHNSVFGPLDNFKLILNGQVIVNDKEFELSGPVEGHPEFLIRIALKKVDELIEHD
ncbi:MAG TPA: GrlR family regulatory protein [Nitrospiraceae bacterium]|nr:GrlR family regulatory protein [Nitrospiraceae bacterium]